jgi:hypothetical protein
MNLSEVKTMDGVGLVEGQEYYTLALEMPLGRFYIIKCKPVRMEENSIRAEIPHQKREANYPIIDGQAFGLKHFARVPEAGLGKGAQ